jgi:DNA end-binding protein Ku
VPGEDVAVNDRELQMARQLVEALSGSFEPEKYHDEYRDQLLDLIERKAAGEDIVAEPAAEAPAKVLDLMAALEASLANAGGSSRGAEGADVAATTSKRAPAKKAVGSKKATPAKKAAAAKKSTRRSA